MGRPFIDITGEKFGNLQAIKYVGKDTTTKEMYRLWLCNCTCGKQKTARYRDLVRMHTTSCGCIAFSGLIAGGHNKLSYGEARGNDLLLSYKRRASKRGVPFTLSRDQFRTLTKQNCFYCGSQPSQIISSGKQQVNGEYVYNGIDRIDSSGGYTPENTRPCCKHCNIAKHEMSETEFYAWIEKVANHTMGARYEHGERG